MDSEQVSFEMKYENGGCDKKAVGRVEDTEFAFRIPRQD